MVVYFAEQILNKNNNSFDGKRVAISGSGNVAQFAAEEAIELGGKVISFSDSSGTIYDVGGIDKEKLSYVMELKNIRRGRIKNMLISLIVSIWKILVLGI